MSENIETLLKKLDITKNQLGCSTGSRWFANGDEITAESPVDGSKLGTVRAASFEDYEKVLQTAEEAFISFRKIPAPIRGDMVRQFGNALRDKKELLGQLVSWEMGKSLQEGYGEVQEMIDI
ncbi:MAG: aldehyde dehydrogenase family protein, partial [Candidatus Arcticimaribacter sp.]